MSWKERAKERAKKAYEKGFELEKPFKMLGFQFDPWDPTLPLEEDIFFYDTKVIGLFIEEVMGRLKKRDEMVKEPRSVANLDFFAKKLMELHFLFIGPSGSGKTTIFQVVNTFLDSSDIIEDRASPIKSLYIDSDVIWDGINEPSETNILVWLTENEKELEKGLDLLFVDNIARTYKFWPFLLEKINKYCHPVIVGSLTHSELDWLETLTDEGKISIKISEDDEEEPEDTEDLDNYSKKESFFLCFQSPRFYIQPFLRLHEMTDLIGHRIAASHPRGDIYTKEAIERVAFYSLGLPGLAIDMAHEATELAAKRGELQIEAALIDRIAEQKGYKVAAQFIAGLKEISVTSFYINDMADYITTVEELQGEDHASRLFRQPKKKMLQRLTKRAGEAQIIKGNVALYAASGKGTTTTYLSKALQEWTPSTVSYHLGDLEKRGFVKVTNYGKKRIYYVDGPVLAAMEIFFQLTGEY